MPGKIQFHKLTFLLQVCMTFALLASPLPTKVEAESAPFNAYDLIGSVNALRAEYGLPAFNINGSLMASAQAHTEYQAGILTLTHNGPGGNTPNERAAAAGYPGRVSENIAVFSLSFDNALTWVIYQAWADDIHLNTMINAQYKDVGAGVVVGGDMVYITLDAGWPEGRYTLPTRVTRTPGNLATADLTILPVFEPIVVSTPQPDGSLVHVVGYGQSLSGIAGAYDIPVTDLATLNHINPDQIYDGQKLLIRKAITPTTHVESTNIIPSVIPPSSTAPPAAAAIPVATPTNPMRIIGMIIIGVCIAGSAILLTARRK
jgi:uncharacterized protein YkwD